MEAVPDASVRWVPLAGQRSWVVRYWTVVQTSKLAAGWPSRFKRMMTFSVLFWAGDGSETDTAVPVKRSARPGRTVGVGAGVASAGDTVASTVRRALLDRGRTFCRALSPDRLID